MRFKENKRFTQNELEEGILCVEKVKPVYYINSEQCIVAIRLYDPPVPHVILPGKRIFLPDFLNDCLFICENFRSPWIEPYMLKPFLPPYCRTYLKGNQLITDTVWANNGDVKVMKSVRFLFDKRDVIRFGLHSEIVEIYDNNYVFLTKRGQRRFRKKIGYKQGYKNTP